MKLTTSIVSYNTAGLTRQAVECATGYKQGAVIVVDNASSDDTVSILKRRYGKKRSLILEEKNAGFSRANNDAIRQSESEYILLLNSDTITTGKTIENLVACMDSHTEYGIIAASLCNSDATYQPQGGVLPTLFSVACWWLWPLPGTLPFAPHYHDQTQPSVDQEIVDRGWVGGTAMMIRRSMLSKIGLLDENIFMYAEDVDLCIRAKHAGYSVGICPSAIVTHFGSASGESAHALLGEMRGLQYLFAKHGGRGSEIVFLCMCKFAATLRYLLFGILGRRKDARALYGEMVWM